MMDFFVNKPGCSRATQSQSQINAENGLEFILALEGFSTPLDPTAAPPGPGSLNPYKNRFSVEAQCAVPSPEQQMEPEFLEQNPVKCERRKVNTARIFSFHFAPCTFNFSSLPWEFQRVA
jgi:hypothetical protein